MNLVPRKGIDPESTPRIIKTKKKISGYVIRSAILAVLLSSAIVGFTSAFKLPGRWSARPESVFKPATQARTLTFADRVAYQRAIEEVYWRHRDWPATDGSAKPSLDQVMPQAQIEKKVEDYLRNSQALEDYWQQSITPEQLQAEMERMARHSKKPEVLRELFAALGNDPFVIAECLARPALSDRLARSFYAHDQTIHGELKQRAEAALQARPGIAQLKQTLPAAASPASNASRSNAGWRSDAGAASGTYRKSSGLRAMMNLEL